MMKLVSSSIGVLACLCATSSLSAVPLVTFDFEGGTASGWVANDGVTVAVTADAAITGDYGLAVTPGTGEWKDVIKITASATENADLYNAIKDVADDPAGYQIAFDVHYDTTAAPGAPTWLQFHAVFQDPGWKQTPEVTDIYTAIVDSANDTTTVTMPLGKYMVDNAPVDMVLDANAASYNLLIGQNANATNAFTYDIDNIRIETVGTSGPTWATWPVEEDGWVNTGSFIGWVYPMDPVEAGWLWSDSLQNWIYLPETAVETQGAWVFVARAPEAAASE